MKTLVTGSAGFIGFHLTEALLNRGDFVVGIDNINSYYDPELKYARLKESGIDKHDIDWNKEVKSHKNSSYRFIRMNLEDKANLMALCEREHFDVIINLAAQAGVRYSIENPDAYVQSNLVGFLNILEASRYNNIKHLVYASSSSVYGMNTQMPFSIKHNVDHPVSLYAATKKANELMAHSYSSLYGIPTTGLRFFTVYGPWGRPDMAYFLFANAIAKGESIKVFNYGNLKRDFTYIDDIVNGIINVVDSPAKTDANWNAEVANPSSSKYPYKIYNIGNNKPVQLMDFIGEIETNMGKKVEKEMVGMQSGDVYATWADIDDIMRDFDYKPKTSIETGLKNFTDWYTKYYNLNN